MKFLICFVFLTSLASNAQRLVEGDIFPGIEVERNYIINESARLNATVGTATSSATLTRDTDVADRIDGVASFLCDTSATNGYCEWLTKTIQHPDQNGNCSASIAFKGDGSLYRLQVHDGTSLLAESSLIGNQTNWTTITVPHACGLNRRVRLTQTTAGTSPAVNVGKVKWGKIIADGSVSSNTSGLERVERAIIGGSTSTTNCTSSPCTVHSQSGSWISGVTRSTTGNYVVTMTAFSGTPSCTCTARDAAAATVRGCYSLASSNTSAGVVIFYTANTSNGATTSTDAHFHIICMGPR